MTTDLVLPEGMNLVAKNVDDEAFSDVAKSSSFLPRLQLCGASSDAVKEGKVPMGHFALANRKEMIPLGAEIHIVNFGMRLKALDMSDKPPKAYYDPKSADFQRVKAMAEKKVKGEQPKGLCGCEFLVWIPDQKTFATFYLANATLLGEAKKVRALIGKRMSLKSDLKSNAKFKWHGMLTFECSLPLEMPSKAELLQENRRFTEQEAPEVVADEAATAEVEPEARPQ